MGLFSLIGAGAGALARGVGSLFSGEAKARRQERREGRQEARQERRDERSGNIPSIEEVLAPTIGVVPAGGAAPAGGRGKKTDIM